MNTIQAGQPNPELAVPTQNGLENDHDQSLFSIFNPPVHDTIIKAVAAIGMIHLNSLEMVSKTWHTAVHRFYVNMANDWGVPLGKGLRRRLVTRTQIEYMRVFSHAARRPNTSKEINSYHTSATLLITYYAYAKMYEQLQSANAMRSLGDTLLRQFPIDPENQVLMLSEACLKIREFVNLDSHLMTKITEIDLSTPNEAPAPMILPPEFGNLRGLTSLTMNSSRLVKFPVIIWDELRQLKSLSLDHNCIQYIPKEIRNLTNLQKLTLVRNCLTKVPNTIGDLTRLEILGLSKNKIEVLPGSLTKLNALNTLLVGDNLLKELPDLSLLTSLKRLETANNPFNLLFSE